LRKLISSYIYLANKAADFTLLVAVLNCVRIYFALSCQSLENRAEYDRKRGQQTARRLPSLGIRCYAKLLTTSWRLQDEMLQCCHAQLNWPAPRSLRITTPACVRFVFTLNRRVHVVLIQSHPLADRVFLERRCGDVDVVFSRCASRDALSTSRRPSCYSRHLQVHFCLLLIAYVLATRNEQLPPSLAHI